MVTDSLIRAALLSRELLLRVLTPLDGLWALVRDRQPLPPLWLRSHVGAAAAARYTAAVSEGTRHLDGLLNGTGELSSVLDVGCGCGSMVPYFQRRLAPDGVYRGLDTHRGCIEWCERQYAKDPRFSFRLLPSAERPVPEVRFQLVLAKSLFTHLLRDAALTYLREISKILAPDGRLILTVFLYNQDTHVPAFAYADADRRVRYRRKWRPQAAVAFERTYFHSLLEAAGLVVERAEYLFWPGAHTELAAQDLLVCRTRQSPATQAADNL